MREDFLHYVWKHSAFTKKNLKTVGGSAVVVKQLGQHNFNTGPDFFNAQLTIDKQLWAGNVEMHLKSSDWYVHNHETDSAYDNVILHVVWEHDTEIYRKDNSKMATLELRHYVAKNVLKNYKKIEESKSWINCKTDFPEIDNFLLSNWLDRLYIERLQRKSEDILELLKSSNNDWEAVLFKMLFKNFGLKVNGDAFLSLAKSFEYTVIRKLQNATQDVEALLFGQANFLNDAIQDDYFLDLKRRYNFISQKFSLTNQGVLPLQFFRLRPSNFPTIRLSQYANLYTSEKQLFSKLMALNKREDFYKLFKKGATDFWSTHYTFSKTSKRSKKVLTKAFVDLLIINTIIPLKFTYAKFQGKVIHDQLLALIRSMPIEKNTVSAQFLKLKPIEKSALNSQALLQLKYNYCDKNKCLQCAIGSHLITKNK